MPLCVLEHTNVKDDVERIVSLAREHAAADLVVGDPIALDGSRGPACERIDAFVRTLERRFEGTIHRVAERLSTAHASKGLIAADVCRSTRRARVDKIAAALILETFLLRRKNRAHR